MIATLAMAVALASTAAEPRLATPAVTTVSLPFAVSEKSQGGLVAADVDADGAMDLIVTRPGALAAVRVDGTVLWVREADIVVGGSSEAEGLPGHHGPGVQAGDVEGDGSTDVLFLTRDGLLHVCSGATGEDRWTARPPVPDGAERWEHAIVCCLRGAGDRDILLQATNRDGYRMGRYLAAYSAEGLREGEAPLWTLDDFPACAHNGARVADLDGDGRDEVLSAAIVGPDGAMLCHPPIRGHVDSVFVDDVRPDLPGLEVVLLEEGGEDGNRVFLLARDRVIWETHCDHQEPQNAAIGRFDPDRPGIQVWCRSRYDTHQRPFVFDSAGALIRQYAMDDVAPEGWTEKGVEVIHTITWSNGPQLACAKERHESGEICLFDPVSGQFLWWSEGERADRLYVADVLGDWREEMVVWSGSELRIYANTEPDPQPGHPRLWDEPRYRRGKMTWNYYSP